MKNIQILTQIPLAGEYKEINFGTTNDLTWVLFIDNDLTKFIGKFDRGNYRQSKVEILENEYAIILSGGFINLFNIYNKELIYSDNNEQFDDFIIDHENKLLVLNDDLSLFVYDYTFNLIHQTERVSVDGFKFDKVENGIVMGKFNDLSDDWGTFKYNILLNEFDCDWKLQEHWPNV